MPEVEAPAEVSPSPTYPTEEVKVAQVFLEDEFSGEGEGFGRGGSTFLGTGVGAFSGMVVPGMVTPGVMARSVLTLVGR